MRAGTADVRRSHAGHTRHQARLVLLLLGLIPLGILLGGPAQAAAYAAEASVTPQATYLGESTFLTFTVKNTGTSTTIGAVEINRPNGDWTITACPTAPLGWRGQADATRCRYRSAGGTGDDLKPGRLSSLFTMRTTPATGSQNRVGTWRVVVSKTNSFAPASSLAAAPAASGSTLTTTAHSFQVLAAGIASSPAVPGAACPVLSKEAVTGSTQNVVVCGRNRATVALTPIEANSNLTGTWIATEGTFASGSVAPATTSRVLGTWNDAATTGSFGPDKTVIATIGSASTRTSPATTLAGYTATNRNPSAVDDAVSTGENTSSAIPVMANDSDADGNAFDITSFTQPPAGTVTRSANDLVFDPGAAFDDLPAGTDEIATFTYTITDSFGASDTATVTVTVNGVNDAPVASDAAKTTDEDTAVDVVLNATDVDGETLTFDVAGGPSNGTLNCTADCTSTITYTPDANFNGGDSFTFTASDGTVDSAPKTATLTVTSVNDQPDAVDDAKAMDENTATPVAVLTNDSDADGDTLDVASVTQPAKGLVTLVDGAVTFNPDGDFEGLDDTESEDTTFTYTISDGNGGSDTATVTVTVNGVNDAPVAADVARTTDEDTPADVFIAATDADGETLKYTVVTDPTNGSLGCTSNCGSPITYTPNANYHGADSFTFTADDGTADSNVATATLTVTSVNDAPVAADDAAATDENTDVPVTVLANDSDVDGDALTASVKDQPAKGVVTFTDNVATFKPSGAFEGLDDSESENVTFTYTAADGNGGTATATVTVTVNGVNDAPVAADAAKTTAEDTPADVALSATDVDGEALTFTVTGGPSNGSLGCTTSCTSPITYTPDANFKGGDSFTFTASDGTVASAPATATLTVTSVNDPVDAVDDAVDTDEDSPVLVAVLGNDTDADSDPLTVTSVTTPGKGTATINEAGTAVMYSPNGAFEGLDATEADGTTFTYTISDGNGSTDTATVTVTVSGVNDAPVASDLAKTTNEDTAVEVTLSAADVDNESLTFGNLTPTNGTVGSVGTVACLDGTCTAPVQFTPAANYNGTASFTYTANDGTVDSAPKTATITVNAVNDAPSFTKGADQVVIQDSGAQTVQGWATGISAGPADEAGQTLTFTLTVPVGNAGLFSAAPAVDPANGNLTYTPAPGQIGATSVDVVLSDNGGGANTSGTQSFTITINPPNATPTADATSASGNEDGGAITVTLTGHDADGDALTFTAGTATNGLVSVPGSISCDANVPSTCTATSTYTPNANFNGEDTFTYTVNDGTVDSAAKTATITVNAVNDAPSFTKGADVTVLEDSGASSTSNWATAISKGPADESGQTLSFNVSNDNNALFSAQPAINGTTGTLTFTSAANANGSAFVTVSLSDNGGTDNGGVNTSGVQTFLITVESVNDAPDAVNDSTTTNEDTSIDIPVMANDSDVDNAFEITAINDGDADENGDVDAVITENANGTIKYNPAGLFDALQVGTNATDVFTYTITDASGATDTATVTVTVTPVNDNPTVTNKNYTATGNTLLTVETVATAPHTTNTGLLSVGITDPDDSSFTITTTGTSTNAGTVVAATNGAFSFLPAQGYTGTDTFTFTVTDANSGTGEGTASVVVSNRVWYVDNSLAAAGDGRSTTPFNTIAPLNTGGSADAKDGAGDFIFVYQGTASYTGGLQLESTQKLYGQPHGLLVAGTQLVPAGGSNPVINGGITLANTTDVQGLTAGTHTGYAISGTSVGTSLVGTVTGVTVNNPSAGGIFMNGGSPTVALAKLTSGGGESGIRLASVTTSAGTPGSGTVTVSDATSAITGTTNHAVWLTFGNGNVTYPGTITTGANVRSLLVSNQSAGAVTLTGAITDGGGMSLVNNTGSTINVNGPLTISTTGSTYGIHAIGGGTLNMANANNVVTTMAAAAAYIENTTIGANDVVFKTVNVNTAGTAFPTHGLFVSNTGAAGELRVLGTGTTAGSGGLIRGTSNVGVTLLNTKTPVLTNLKIQDTQNHGISAGTITTGLTLTNVEVIGAGDADNERAVDMTGVTGAIAISDGTYSDATDDLVKLVNTSGVATVTVNGAAEFKDLTQPTANNALQFVPNGTAVINATVNGASTFTNLKNSAVNFGADAVGSSGASSLTFSGNTVNGGAQGGAGILVSGQENTTTTTTIANNTFTGAGGNGVITHDVNDNATVLSTVANNQISGAKAHAIVSAVDETGDIRQRIDANPITNAGADGIQLVNFGDNNVGTSTANFIVTNNTVNGHSQTAAVAYLGAINVTQFDANGDTTCANIAGNTVTGSNPAMGFYDIWVQGSQTAGTGLFRYEETPNLVTSGDVAPAYIQSKNPGTALANIVNAGNVKYSDGVVCTAP